MVRGIKISSEFRNIHEVEQFLNSMLKEFDIPRKIYCKIYLATTEGVNNAILHGNKEDASKTVEIVFKNKRTYFEVGITDQGNGFNMEVVPDPTDKTNLRRESGRGIFIMRQYADKLKFTNNGSNVQLIFNK